MGAPLGLEHLERAAQERVVPTQVRAAQAGILERLALPETRAVEVRVPRGLRKEAQATRRASLATAP